jgi:undecaprenol kinase
MSKLRRSFQHALAGLYYVLKYERNFQIELVIGIFIGTLILILKLKGWEAIVLILMIMWVLITELTNTVFEKVVDILKPRIHPYARLIKDIMAAVVLISCIVAMIIGVIIFLPYAREMWAGY